MSRRVRIRHPGYEQRNVLFEFPARDGRNEAHYPTIIAACSIISDHAEDPWLENAATLERVTPSTDDLMPAGDYFLRINLTERSAQYPIVPNFEVWAYPHRDLPHLWQEAADNHADAAPSSTHESVGTERCRITNKRLAVNDAHIVPTRESEWFADNDMGSYSGMIGRSGTMLIDSPANMMRLQVHAHRLWDSLHFCIVPRRSDGETTWVTQMMVDDDEVEEDWHRKKLQSLASRAKEHLFARFAWQIFPRLIYFLESKQPRNLTVAAPGGTKTTRMHTPAECRKFTLGQGAYRSASPTKRSRSARDDQAGEGLDWGSDLGSVDSAVAGMSSFMKDHHSHGITAKEWFEHYDEEPRGRKRQRKGD